jgi:outer membrane lipoprotein LolB
VTRAVRLAAALGVAALVAACAQFEPRPPDGPLEFQLTGRLAARYEAESFTGNVTWSHARQGDEMLISSPLGQGVARILRDAEGVVLRTAEPREYRAADAETLTQKALGFRLPLVGLGDWVRARPADGQPFHIERSPEGQVRVLEQQGWRIEYLEYEGARPKLMRLVYPGIELRFAVTEWK